MKYERGDLKIPDLRAMLTKDKLKINGYFIIKNLQVNEKNKFDFIDLEILITAPQEWDTYAKQIKAHATLDKLAK